MVHLYPNTHKFMDTETETTRLLFEFQHISNSKRFLTENDANVKPVFVLTILSHLPLLYSHLPTPRESEALMS